MGIYALKGIRKSMQMVQMRCLSENIKTLPKAQWTQGLSSAYQNNFFGHIKVLAQVMIKFHLQNIDQASTSKSQQNLSISTKLKLQNLNQT